MIQQTLVTVNKILLTELKKGGSNLSRQERDQAVHYIEDFIDCGNLIGKPTIDAYILGQKYSEKVEQIVKVGDRGKVSTCIFDQLIDTAEKRLFGLRNKLIERYDDIPGMDLFRQQSTQLRVDFSSDPGKAKAI